MLQTHLNVVHLSSMNVSPGVLHIKSAAFSSFNLFECVCMCTFMWQRFFYFEDIIMKGACSFERNVAKMWLLFKNVMAHKMFG